MRRPRHVVVDEGGTVVPAAVRSVRAAAELEPYRRDPAADEAEYTGRQIKVHGVVVGGTVKQKKGGAGDYTFEIEKDGRRLPVHFTNMVPDTFQEGGEVVLTGELVNGRFESEEMAAKCPSKYEEQVSADPTATKRKP